MHVILVVDDDAGAVEAIAQSLRSEGQDVVILDDGVPRWNLHGQMTSRS
jgi:CheY-like chemotaxis protein